MSIKKKRSLSPTNSWEIDDQVENERKISKSEELNQSFKNSRDIKLSNELTGFKLSNELTGFKLSYDCSSIELPDGSIDYQLDNIRSSKQSIKMESSKESSKIESSKIESTEIESSKIESTDKKSTDKKLDSKKFKDILKDDKLYKYIIKPNGIERSNELQKLILKKLLDTKLQNVFIKTNFNQNKELSYLLYAAKIIDTSLFKPQVCIVVPHTELVNQLNRMCDYLFKSYPKKLIINSVHEYDFKKEKITSQLIITTLGLFNSLINTFFNLDTSKIKLCIFDSIDTYTDFSFLAINNISKHLIDYTRIIFLSSALGDDVYVNLTSLKYLSNLPIIDEANYNHLRNILHFYVSCENRYKLYQALERIIKKMIIKDQKIIIYVVSKKSADFVFDNLKKFKINLNIYLLTSGLSFKRRSESITKFKQDKQAILVTIFPLTTNVNLKASIIINYDLPLDEKSNQLKQYFFHSANLNESKVGFIVNLVNEDFNDNKYSGNRRKILESKFNFKMIKLKLIEHNYYKR